MRNRFAGLALTGVLMTAGCTSQAASGSNSEAAGTIPQPEVGALQVAPEETRVDVAMPTFSDPTNITNPLFPVSMQGSVVLVGEVEGEPFRTEVTLLPYTRIIEWEGQTVEVLVSQYVAFLSGRIHEVAYDMYAQADDGSVWYFGEDVFNFHDGAIVDTHGTWMAGQDGPAAMIMPGDPKVGDVYRPENIPGFVFEEVTVKSVDETLDGPFGPVEGGLLIEELHMDGTTEAKTFGPGYGEFYTSGGGDTEALALAVPTDAQAGEMPVELETMHSSALAIVDSAGSGDWDAAAASLDGLNKAWESYRAGGVPALIEPILMGSIDTLSHAVERHDSETASQAAIDSARSTLDLQLRSRPVAEVDVDRFDLWLAQMGFDSEARDAGAVNGDFFALDYVRDRILPQLEDSDSASINAQLEELLNAIGEEDFNAVIERSEALRDTLKSLEIAR